jgi:hypothetical protein
VLDDAAITIEGAENGDAAFGYNQGSPPPHLVVPLPRGCRVVKRTRNVISLRCPGDYGAVFGFYTRLTAPYEATRRRFGGQFDEYGRVGIFRREPPLMMTIDVARGDHASLGIRTGGAPLRVRGEPAGPIETDPELPDFADGTDRFLRAYGAYRCNGSPVFVNVRTVVWRRGEVETECRNLALSPAGSGGAVRVICGNIVGREEDLGGRGSRFRAEGFVIRGLGTTAEIDGSRCTPDPPR